MKSKKIQLLNRRKNRVRAKISWTAICPRMSVRVSNSQILVQLINDEKGETLCSSLIKKSNIEAWIELGKKITEEAKKSKITTCVFDRNWKKFHWIVKAVADTARKWGIKF